jgi:hypothetical protein
MLTFRIVSLLITAVGAHLMAAQDATRPAPPREANVGVVRADGVVLPLAAVRDGIWRPLSTEGGSGGSAMTAEARKLPLAGWTVVPTSGSIPRPFTLTKPATVEYRCSSSEVFDTSLSAPRRLQREDSFRHLGLAMNGTGTIESAVDLVARPDAASRDVRQLITRTGQALEAERVPGIKVWEPELQKSIQAQQATRPVEIVRLFRHFLGPVPWHYFEAEKRYAQTEIVFFVSGWIGAFGMETRLTEVRASFGSEGDNPPLPPTEVLGVVRSGPLQGATWVLAWHTNVDLTYSLIQVGAGGGGDTYSWHHVLDVTANHCVP